MSALCGMYRFDGAPIAASDLGRMSEALAPFGPPAGCWIPEGEAAPVGFALRADAVPDRDRAAVRPVTDEQNGIVLVADARVDNRAELLEALGVGVEAGRQLPDGALLARAWLAWGAAFPRRVFGDYAFALWDGRTRTFACGRDHAGVRALYHHRGNGFIAFGTTPAAVLAAPAVPRRLNERRVADFLVLLQDPVSTFYDGIERVPAGHVLVATAGSVRLHRYWAPDQRARIRLGSDAEYVEAFRAVFDQAVDARLDAAGDVGVLLSAGLDSSAVAAVVAGGLAGRGRRLVAYHAAPRPGADAPQRPGWIVDESEQVRAFAALHPAIDLQIIHAATRSPFHGVDRFFEVVGAPVKNVTNRLWMDVAYEAAGARGLRVMLTGQKGNATFSYTGLLLLRHLARRGRWLRLGRETRALASARERAAWALLKDVVIRPVVAPWRARLRRRPRRPLWEPFAIDPAFARELDVDARMRASGADPAHTYREDSRRQRARMLVEKPYANDVYDAFRGMFGIETRDPTADARVIEFCLGVPEEQFLHSGRDRLLARRAFEGRLPSALLWRRARGEQAADWPRLVAPFRGEIANELRLIGASDLARRILDVGRLQKIVDAWPARLGEEHAADYHFLLLRGVMMGRFLRWFEGARA